MIQNTSTAVQALLNGIATSFGFPNKIFFASDLAITLIDNATPPNLYPFTFTSGATFQNTQLGMTATVSGVDVDTGCTVTLSSGGTAGWAIDIRTATPNTQATSIKNQGSFDPELHEEAFDKLTREVQDLRRLVYTFGIHGPDNESLPWTQLPDAATRANLFLQFDSAGLPMVVPSPEANTSVAYGNLVLQTFTTDGATTTFTLASNPVSINNIQISIGGLNLTPGVDFTYSGTTVVLLALPPAGLSMVVRYGQAVTTTPVTTPTMTVTNQNISVPANSSGVVSSFANATGQAQLWNGTTDVSSFAAWSIVSSTNCTAAINTSANVPVNGKPIGYYAFSALTQPVGSITIQAVYQGQTYQIVVNISAAIAGASGPPGVAGAGIQLVLSVPTTTVLAYANGGIPSLASLFGQARVLNNGVDVSSSAAFSVISQTGLTGTVNTAANTPVAGQPIGFYEVTSMSATTGSMTIQAIYSATTLTATFTVTQVPIGYEIVAALPTTNLFAGRIVYLTTDGKLYRYTGTAWTPAVAASDITGQLTDAQIAAIAAAKLTGQITTTQITPGAITTPLLAAAAVKSANIAAGTIVAANVAAGTLTSSQIAAGSITSNSMATNSILANSIAAGAVTAAKIAVTSLSSLSANIGTVTSGVLESAAGTTVLDLNNEYIKFNNGVNMLVEGNGFGVGGTLLMWYGPTQASIATCSKTNAFFYQATDGTSYHGGSINFTSSLNVNGGYIKFPKDNTSGYQFIEQFGTYNQSPSSPDIVTFPIPFPHACLNVMASPYNAAETYWVGGFTTTGFTLGFGASSQSVCWRSIGY